MTNANEEQVFFPLPLSRLEPIFKSWMQDVLTSLDKKGETIPDSDQFIGIKEAADFIDLAVPTVYNMVSARQIPFMKRRQKLYFSKVELSAWIKEGRKQTIAEIEKDAEHSVKKFM